MNSQSDLEKSPEGLVVTAADLETRAVSELILEMTGDNADGMEEHEDIEGANPTSDASVLLEGKDKKENRKSRAAMSTNVPDILSAKAAIAARNQSLDPTLLAEASQPVTNQRKVSTMSAPGAFAASPSPGVASEDDEASNVSTSDDEEPRSNQATTIVSADLVDEEQMNLEREASFRRRMLVNTVKATEVTVTNENETSSFFQQWKLTILSVVGVLALVATGLGIALSRSDGDGAGLSDTEFLHELLLPVSGEALLEEGSPQSKALEWLLYKDPMDLPIQSTNSSTLLERYVMVVLYYSTGGPEWDDQLGFLTNRSICEWPNINQDESTATTSNEVDCGDRGTVVKIRIGTYGITIWLSGIWIYVKAPFLTFLVAFPVESNNMNGTIVSELGALSDLEIISLSNGNLHGTLPRSLADPPKLNFIQFVGQQLTGPLPSSFNNFPSLEILSVHNNALSGTIPDGLVFGADLEILDLSKNDFRGTIPAFNTQSGLRMVFLEENDLEGPIPSTLYTQPKLEILSLSNNRLNGTIAPQIRGMADLNLFLGHDNYFTGSIPSELGSLQALRELNLSSNDMTRGIPSQLGGLFQLTTLDLSSNYLTGMIPKELGEARALVKLSLKSNALTGVLPVSFASNAVIGTYQ